MLGSKLISVFIDGSIDLRMDDNEWASYNSCSFSNLVQYLALFLHSFIA